MDRYQDIPARLNNLGISFLSYFEYTGDVWALTKAISTQQQAVQLIPCGHPDLPGWLSNLGMLHCRHFECTCDVSDLDEAILAQQRAVQLTHDGHIAMPGRLANLGTLFQCRFEHTGNASHIGKSHRIDSSVYRSCTMYRYNGAMGPHGVGRTYTVGCGIGY